MYVCFSRYLFRSHPVSLSVTLFFSTCLCPSLSYISLCVSLRLSVSLSFPSSVTYLLTLTDLTDDLAAQEAVERSETVQPGPGEGAQVPSGTNIILF